MKTIKKLVAVALTLAMVISVAPTFNAVKAGDGMDIKSITKGTNADDSVYVTKPITIKGQDLLDSGEVDGDFLNRVEAGKAYMKMEVFKTQDFNSFVREEKFVYKDGEFEFYPYQKDKGKYYMIYIHDPEGTNLNDSNWYLVKGCNITISDAPKVENVFYTTPAFLKKDISVDCTGSRAVYSINEDANLVNYYADVYCRLYKGNNVVATKKVVNNEATFKNVSVSYGKADKFKAELLIRIKGMSSDIGGPVKSFTIQTTTIPKIKVFATKISSKKAYLRWQKVSGVTGYIIYMGKKKVKTVGAKTWKKMITKKKAGKSKFTVKPYIKVGKNTYKGTSNKAKPKKNQCKFNRSKVVKDYPYATCKFVTTKISLKGKKYTVTGYAMNNRMWDVKKYKSLKLTLYVDGKKAFSKTYKNKKLKIKEYKKKKLTFKIKGKAGKDLANGAISIQVKEDPDWGIKNDPFKD